MGLAPAEIPTVTDATEAWFRTAGCLLAPNAGKVLVITDSMRLTTAEVGCALTFEVAHHVVLALQVAAATPVELDGRSVPVDEVEVERGGRVHIVACAAGRLTVNYHGVVQRMSPDGPAPTVAEKLFAVRPSRYCPSDLLEAFADAELGMPAAVAERGRVIGDWVFGRLRYEPGSSGPLDTAVDTLLAGRGVCRDFAHLTVALCRAAGVPARLASVYAPGVTPMDFHAVAEVATTTGWELVDATRLAPRQSLVRIATGRDAGDTAFSTTLDGAADLVGSGVMAFVHGDLPIDDHLEPVTLA